MIYRIIGKDFTESKKMVQIDGTYYNPTVNVSSGGTTTQQLGKITDLETRIKASKEGYNPDSTDITITPGGSYTQDFSLTQIPKQDTITIDAIANMLPTNTPANNANIVGKDSLGATLLNGTTNNNGEYQGFLVVHYITNPSDTTDKKYFPSSIILTANRNNTQGTTHTFSINGNDINWNPDLQQTLINKNGVASGHVQDDNNQPIQNANAKALQQRQQQLTSDKIILIQPETTR